MCINKLKTKKKYYKNKSLYKVNKVRYIKYNLNNIKYYYSNNSNNKIFINFLGIKSICKKC